MSSCQPPFLGPHDPESAYDVYDHSGEFGNAELRGRPMQHSCERLRPAEPELGHASGGSTWKATPTR